MSALNPKELCRVCLKKKTSIRFNINFDPVPVCDDCAWSIALQQVQEASKNKRNV